MIFPMEKLPSWKLVLENYTYNFHNIYVCICRVWTTGYAWWLQWPTRAAWASPDGNGVPNGQPTPTDGRHARRSVRGDERPCRRNTRTETRSVWQWAHQIILKLLTSPFTLNINPLIFMKQLHKKNCKSIGIKRYVSEISVHIWLDYFTSIKRECEDCEECYIIALKTNKRTILKYWKMGHGEIRAIIDTNRITMCERVVELIFFSTVDRHLIFARFLLIKW